MRCSLAASAVRRAASRDTLRTFRDVGGERERGELTYCTYMSGYWLLDRHFSFLLFISRVIIIYSFSHKRYVVNIVSVMLINVI